MSLEGPVTHERPEESSLAASDADVASSATPQLLLDLPRDLAGAGHALEGTQTIEPGQGKFPLHNQDLIAQIAAAQRHLQADMFLMRTEDGREQRRRLSGNAEGNTEGAGASSGAQRPQMDLQLHPEWQGKSVDVQGLYCILHRGDPDAALPVLSSLRIPQPITIRQLTALSAKQLAQITLPAVADLHQASASSKDPTQQTGRAFAEMALDLTCMGILLSEALPASDLQAMSFNLMDDGGRLDASLLPDIIAAAGLTDQQRQQTRRIWESFREGEVARRAQFDGILSSLNAVSRAPQGARLHAGSGCQLMGTIMELMANLTLQREARTHLIRTFVLSIMTPFQIGHMASSSYPHVVAWLELVAEVGEASLPAAAVAAASMQP